ncbi:MAG: LysM peptidoglycan-binding domain-containing protein [Anaerolineae bacterium]|nr:LysM peptidoglycan-binding domain-containing protein [Anaerolineae bacterium]MCA9890111.1 LysM peptidoglycan-binding domain-containing protein [Anaerolineae bacterium]
MKTSFVRLVVLVAIMLLGVSAVSAQYQTHIVQRGETLSQIAVNYGVNLTTLAQINNISNPSRIYPGQRLVIPQGYVPPVTVATYYVQPGDTLQKIAVRYGTTWQALAAYNNIANPNRIWVGMAIQIPGTGYQPPVYPQPQPSNYYYVQYGDTMLRIAARFGVNVWRLAEANGIYNLNWIYAGQRLIIP